MAIHKFVNAISNNEEITVFGDGSQTRDFTYVDDAIDANILAAENNIIGEVFNIGGGSRIGVNVLIDEIERLIGNKAKKKLGWMPMINIYNLTFRVVWATTRKAYPQTPTFQ